MFNKLDDKTICLIIIMIFHTIFDCNSVNHSFCNDWNQISNIYSVGTHVFITQGMTTIWVFDTQTVQLSPVKQTLNSIFGEDHFEVVDTVFSFDLNACKSKPKTCADIENARNMVVAIGEKIKSKDTSKPYGYIVYRLQPDYTLKEMNKTWAHNWGLTAESTFSGSFWPSFRRNGSLIIGSAYSKNERTLYLLVNEIDDKKNALYRIYNRELSLDGVWGEWTAFKSVKQIGMFAIRGSVYVVDSDTTINSIQTKKNGLIDKKKISSAKEFFNCFKNSTLLKFKDLPEQRVNDFSEYQTPDLDPYPKWGEKIVTTPRNKSTYTSTTTTTTTSTTSTEQTIEVKTEVTEPPIPKLTTNGEDSESSGQPISGWLIFLLILLIIGLIFVIVLIAILLNIKNKNNDKKAKPPKPLPIAPASAKSGSNPQSPKTSSKAGGGTNQKGSAADQKSDSVRSSMV